MPKLLRTSYEGVPFADADEVLAVVEVVVCEVLPLADALLLLHLLVLHLGPPARLLHALSDDQQDMFSASHSA